MSLEHIPRIAVFNEAPVRPPDQIMSFDELEESSKVLLVRPGVHIAQGEIDPEWGTPSDIKNYGPELYIETLTIAALRTRLVGGISFGDRPELTKYAQQVPDEDYLIALGIGELIGPAYNDYLAKSLLVFSKADLGMEPYRAADGEPVGWSTRFLRPVLEPKMYGGPSWSHRPLDPREIIREIPGTRLL